MSDFGYFLEDSDYDGSEYLVRFALGMPVDLDEVTYWTSLRWIEVHARAREAWISWISDVDLVTDADWNTRVGRLCFDKPWAAAWEYVDWDIKRKLEGWVFGEDAEGDWIQLDDDEDDDDEEDEDDFNP